MARVAKGITQEELAVQIYRTRSLVSQIEQTGQINDFTLWQICDALDIDAIEMMNVIQDPGAACVEEPKNEEILQFYYELETLKEILHYQNSVIDRLQQQIERIRQTEKIAQVQ